MANPLIKPNDLICCAESYGRELMRIVDEDILLDGSICAPNLVWHPRNDAHGRRLGTEFHRSGNYFKFIDAQ